MLAIDQLYKTTVYTIKCCTHTIISCSLMLLATRSRKFKIFQCMNDSWKNISPSLLWQKFFIYAIVFTWISCKTGNSLRDSICAMLTDTFIEGVCESALHCSYIFSPQFELTSKVALGNVRQMTKMLLNIAKYCW